jgi:hypothetical protein
MMVISLTVNPEAPEESILYIHLYSTLDIGNGNCVHKLGMELYTGYGVCGHTPNMITKDDSPHMIKSNIYNYCIGDKF